MKTALALLGAGMLAVPAFQKRVKQPDASDFPSMHQAAREAWDAGKYGTCMEKLKECIGLVSVKRRDTILAAFPGAPEGFTFPEDKTVNAAQNAMLGTIAAGIGNVIDRRYNEENGRGSINMTLTADSPMVQMFSMMINNPAMLDANSELIEYNEHKAVLKKNNDTNLQLQIVIDGKHHVDINARNVSEDELFKFMDQAAVDRLSKALKN